MKPDTPLEDVAHHLPSDVAEHLLAFDMEVQTAVLIQLRSVVVFWETQRYVFDPVAYEGIVTAFVRTLGPLYAEILTSRMNNANLTSRLMGAEALINSMKVTIAALSVQEEGA